MKNGNKSSDCAPGGVDGAVAELDGGWGSERVPQILGTGLCQKSDDMLKLLALASLSYLLHHVRVRLLMVAVLALVEILAVTAVVAVPHDGRTPADVASVV